MITDNIIVAIITGLFATAGVIITNFTSNKRNAIEQAKRDTKLEDTIKELSKRVDEHNSYAEKFSQTSESISLLQKDIEYIKIDVKELKNVPICKVKEG